jgi:CheY-like chemotaxis protein
MPEIGTSGSMSGDGKRSVAERPKLPRPSSTLPFRCSSRRSSLLAIGAIADAPEAPDYWRWLASHRLTLRARVRDSGLAEIPRTVLLVQTIAGDQLVAMGAVPPNDWALTRKDIRIVFTDIEMPGSMDGIRLARAIRNRWPPIELVLTSGKHQFETRGLFLP